MMESSASSRRALALELGLLAPLVCCSLVLFGRALFGDAAFYARDVLHYYWPNRVAIAQMIRDLELPQWAPDSQSGLPLLGDIHAGVLYPPHLLYQVLSFPRAYAWLLFLHHLSAGVGMLLFFRRSGLGKLPSLCGALVLSLSGYVVGLSNAGPLMCGVAYVPWSLLVLRSALPVRARAPILALIILMQCLSGDEQSVLFSALACLVAIAWEKDRKPLWITFVGGFGLAGLLAAIQLVPGWYLLGQSNRASANPRFIEDFSLHPARLLELLSPFPFGRFFSERPFWASFAVNGPGIWPFALSAYLGAAAAAIGAMGFGRDRRTGLGATLLSLGVLLAVGPHGPLGPLLLLPPFRFFRYPEKYLFLACLGIAILASQGVERACSHRVSVRRVRAVGVVVGLLALIALAAHVSGSALEQAMLPILRRAGSRVDPAAAVATLLEAAHWTLAFSGATWALAYLGSRVRGRERVTAGLLTMAIGLDLLASARHIVFTAPIELYQTRPALADQLRRQAPVHPFRYLRDPVQGRTFDRSEEGRLVDFRRWELLTLRSDVGGVFGLEEVTGYGGAFSLARWQAVAFALHQEQAKLGAIFNGCLALSTVSRNVYEKGENFRPLSVDPALGVAVYQNLICQARISAVSAVRGAKSLEEAIQILSEPGFDVARTAVVEGASDGTFAQAEVSEVRAESRRASARVHVPAGGGFALFRTSYYPGWAARVDGEPTVVSIANGATLGIRLPEGNHAIEFEFTDPGLKPGIVLSLLGVLLSIAWLFVGKRLARSTYLQRPVS